MTVHDHLTGEVEEVPNIENTAGGHGGGDHGIMRSFVNACAAIRDDSLTTAREFAGEPSAVLRRRRISKAALGSLYAGLPPAPGRVNGHCRALNPRRLASRLAPPTGFEPVRLVPETSALSPELRGQSVQTITATVAKLKTLLWLNGAVQLPGICGPDAIATIGSRFDCRRRGTRCNPRRFHRRRRYGGRHHYRRWHRCPRGFRRSMPPWARRCAQLHADSAAASRHR